MKRLQSNNGDILCPALPSHIIYWPSNAAMLGWKFRSFPLKIKNREDSKDPHVNLGPASCFSEIDVKGPQSMGALRRHGSLEETRGAIQRTRQEV